MFRCNALNHPGTAVACTPDSTYACQDANGCRVESGGNSAELKKGESVKVDASGEISAPSATKVTTSNHEANDATGIKASNNKARYETARTFSHRGPKRTDIKVGKNIEQENNKIKGQLAQEIQHGDIRGINVENFVINGDGTVSFEKADRIEIKDGLLANVFSFVGSSLQFHVGSTRDVVNGCVTMRNVENADFTVTDTAIIVEPAQGVEFDIADCGFQQSHFEAYSEDSVIAVSKAPNPHYEIKQGKLQCFSLTSSETLEANNTAAVDYGSSCFRCATIVPVGTYWYNDEDDLKKDMGVHIPEDALPYTLCLKKSLELQYSKYDGLIDFIGKKAEFHKIADFMKYPFKNDNVAALLMSNLFQDLNDFKGTLKFDNDLVLFDELFIESNENKQRDYLVPRANEKTTAEFSNFFQVRETAIGADVHRLGRIDFRLAEQKLEQSRIALYHTGYFKPSVVAAEKEFVQQHGSGKITFLEPGHEDIKKVLN